MAESNNNIAELLFSPLSELTRKIRRNLILASSFSVVITKVGLLPTKINAFGIELSKINQKSFLYFTAAIILYFLISFLIYYISEVSAQKYKNISNTFRRKLNKDDFTQTKLTGEEIDVVIKEFEKDTKNIGLIYNTRIFIEVALPIIFSFYALCSIYISS